MQPMDYREEILQKNQLEKHGEQYSVKGDNLFQNMHTCCLEVFIPSIYM